MEKAVLAAKLHAKTAIVVKDAPGFAVNRFFVPFINEAVRLLEEGVAEMFAGVAEALALAHTEGIIHRDIKPSNLLLDDDGVKARRRCEKIAQVVCIPLVGGIGDDGRLWADSERARPSFYLRGQRDDG